MAKGKRLTIAEKIEKFARSVAKNSEPLCGENWHKQKWED